MRLLIKEIKACSECPYYFRCSRFDLDCSLPTIKGTEKKLLMMEIEECDRCPIRYDCKVYKHKKWETNRVHQRKMWGVKHGILKACPLPNVEPKE